MLLKKVMVQMEKIRLEEISSPDKEIGEGYKVLGILPDHLKRLYAVLANNQKNWTLKLDSLLAEKHKKGTVPLKEVERIKKERNIAYNEHRFMHICFWLSVRDEIDGAVEAPGLRLCKNWQVASTNPIAEVEMSLLDRLIEVVEILKKIR